MSIPLEPAKTERRELSEAILEYLEKWVEGAETMPAAGTPIDQDQITGLMAAPAEAGRAIESILADLDVAGQSGIYHPSGGHLSYIPNAGLYSSALADLLATGMNRYTGIVGAAPGMSAIEHGVVRWMLDLFAFPGDAAGVMVSGGSMANFTGVVAARTAQLGDDFGDGVIYVTRHTHHSVAKAARLAGLMEKNIRHVAVDENLRMDPAGLARAIADDRDAGRRPFLVVASAGTTDTGTVDPVSMISEITHDQGLWLHVDAAYGGFFQLTERGKAVLAGIDEADTIAIDPHKGLSIPFGVGALLARKEAHLIDANKGRGAYLAEADQYMGLRDIASLGPELSRPNRGLLVWLPLQLHGVGAFRDALDTSLDLAWIAFDRLGDIPGIETPWRPDLSVVAFRCEDDDVGRAALEAVNADRGVHLSPTTIDDRFILRLAILNRRTTEDHIHRAIDIIDKTLAG